MVKNLPAMRRPGLDPWVGKSPLKEGMATHSNIPAWRIPMDRGAWRDSPWGCKESETVE